MWKVKLVPLLCPGTANATSQASSTGIASLIAWTQDACGGSDDTGLVCTVDIRRLQTVSLRRTAVVGLLSELQDCGRVRGFRFPSSGSEQTGRHDMCSWLIIMLGTDWWSESIYKPDMCNLTILQVPGFCRACRFEYRASGVVLSVKLQR